MSQKIKLYIASSIDGFIATPDMSVKWLDKYNQSGEDFGYEKFIQNIDTQILGETTYNQFKEYYDKEEKIHNFIFSKNKTKKDNINNVKFINQPVKEFITSLDKKIHKKIWIVGGANIMNQFLKENLIDEIILTIMPEILGNGIRLFDNSNKPATLKLKQSTQYKLGVVENHYTK